MQWDDGTECSAEDVVFTARVFKKFQVPRQYAYWKFIRKIEALDEFTFDEESIPEYTIDGSFIPSSKTDQMVDLANIGTTSDKLEGQDN